MVQPDLFAGPSEPRGFSVSEINERVRRLLDEAFGEVHVEGEISGARQHASGHWYFTLKDAAAQLACVLFRSDAANLRFELQQGLRVRATGRLDLYTPQGKYQLKVRRLLPVGQGELELAFRQLKDKLQAEGLFAAERKKPLPRLPRRVALITSPTGAAVRDMITTLSARWPVAHILVVPVTVQGSGAAPEIVRALAFVNRVDGADVIIVGRGGGSLEDLWAFNEESVARAIAASRIPVVSAVGHETDTTISDFVADLRAATPTAAAALVAPHQEEVRLHVHTQLRRMAGALRRRAEVEQQRLQRLLQSYGFKRPGLLLQQHTQSLDAWHERLERGIRTHLERRGTELAARQGRLHALSPRGVLARGYTYCVDPETGSVVSRAARTRAQQRLHVHFADGTVPVRTEAPPEIVAAEEPSP